MQARINDPQSTEELRNVARATFINVAKAFGVLVDREFCLRCMLAMTCPTDS